MDALWTYLSRIPCTIKNSMKDDETTKGRFMINEVTIKISVASDMRIWPCHRKSVVITDC